jgi:hypothetical protein
MSNVRQSSRRRVTLALVLLASAIAACDARATAPAPIRPAATKPAGIEGDTLRCLSGWVIITGVYVCNDDS